MSKLRSNENNIKNYNLNSEYYTRRKKLKNLYKFGIPFPNNFHRNAISDQLHIKYDAKNQDELKLINIKVKIAGRIINRRIMGKSSFITLQDMGGRIQLYIKSNNVSENIYNDFKKWNLGDIIGVHGTLFKTFTGELSVYCNKIVLLTKAIRALPDKFHGLNNQEICYRKRYLDLIVNPRSREVFKIRSRIIHEIRSFMQDHNFIEVETPMIQNIPGGAAARPFITYHNTLNTDLYLRIAPELYLKRLVIGGFERIFEINRNFRNEGLSPFHNPEFTMIELYMAYANYVDLMIFTENILRTLSQKILDSSILKYGDQIFDFNKPFIKMTMVESIIYYNSQIKIQDLNKTESVIDIAKSLGITVNNKWGLGKLQTEIFEKSVKNYLIQPTFITAYPTEVSPLARKNDENPFFADRFEIFIDGQELGNGFSELNDVEDQKNRFIHQAKFQDELNKENIFYDEDYITALEYGLPPTAGLGIGIDRLVMLFTNKHNIKDVILFPTMRPK